MPVQRTYTASDLEKRLKLLSRQLYGKNSKESSVFSLPAGKAGLQSSDSDLTFLKHDLIKIVILSILASGALFFLYFSQLPSKIKLF